MNQPRNCTYLARVAAAMLAIALTLPVSANIPQVEHDTLVALYSSTNGASWTKNTGWTSGASGTECAWFGITCDGAGTHVQKIELANNNLSGTLPNLMALTQLTRLLVGGNHLTGSIPPLTGMTNLAYFFVDNNQLTGNIPSLAGLTGLISFNANFNQLTGPIPPLSGVGLSSLSSFAANTNQLTGSIPALSGLSTLTYFGVSTNQLSGQIPSLSGLISLQSFVVYENQLIGSIPSLNGLTSLYAFAASSNQLSGSIPTLTGSTYLALFLAENNRLSGTLPTLSGLAYLENFRVSNNQLTGVIPDLSGLTKLIFLYVDNNQLSGKVPPLSALSQLQVVKIDHNNLSGFLPPPPSSMTASASTLCPNSLDRVASAAWDNATGISPWYRDCAKTPTTIVLSLSPNSAMVGQTVVASVRVRPVAATGYFRVEAQADANIFCSGTLSNGSGNCSLTFSAGGEQAVTASYQGDDNYQSSSDTFSEVVLTLITQTITNFAARPANPVFVGNGTFTVSATGGGSGNPVTFSIDAASAGVCHAGGTNGATITMLASGTCTVLADQGGNATCAAAPQARLDVTIAAPAKTSASIVLTSSINPSHLGQPVTFAANVRATLAAAIPGRAMAAASAAVGGSVSFSDGAAPLATIALDNNGNADYSTSALGVGSHTITAAYSGDANTQAASISLVQVVNASVPQQSVPAPMLDWRTMLLLAIALCALSPYGRNLIRRRKRKNAA